MMHVKRGSVRHLPGVVPDKAQALKTVGEDAVNVAEGQADNRAILLISGAKKLAGIEVDS